MCIISLAACDPARRIIKEYAVHHDTAAILIYPPDYLYRTNNRNVFIEHYDSLSQDQKDSALFYNSLFVQHLSDSICLSNFVNGFAEELSDNGFRVFLPEQFEEFLSFKGTGYLLNFAQLEIAEFDYKIWPMYEVEGYGDSYTTNGVDIKNWIEFSVRDDTSKMKVFFNKCSYEDRIALKVGVTEESSIGFINGVDFLTLEKIYSAFSSSASNTVQLFSDYILNKYLEQTLKKKPSRFYFFYSQNRKIKKYGKKLVEM
ncbi:MAG: hypothetical protein V2A54_15655 [Bacteroidota bacterium]